MAYRIRATKKEDIHAILNLFENLPTAEKKYLSLSNKKSVIKKEINAGKHTYVITKNGAITAFARESGCPNKYIMLEEIVVDPEVRDQGVGNKLLKHLINKNPKILAKTFSDNNSATNLLIKNGFTITKTSPKGNILYWKRD